MTRNITDRRRLYFQSLYLKSPVESGRVTWLICLLYSLPSSFLMKSVHISVESLSLVLLQRVPVINGLNSNQIRIEWYNERNKKRWVEILLLGANSSPVLGQNLRVMIVHLDRLYFCLLLTMLTRKLKNPSSRRMIHPLAGFVTKIRAHKESVWSFCRSNLTGMKGTPATPQLHRTQNVLASQLWPITCI
jgi:hypothetical protein